MKHTDQQKNILHEIKSGSGNLAIIARAGCGKTSIIVDSIKEVQDEYTMCLTYGKRASVHLEKKIKEAGLISQIKTMHSLGNEMLRLHYGKKYRMNKYKMSKIAKDTMPKRFLSNYKQAQSEAVRIAEIALTNLGNIDVELISKIVQVQASIYFDSTFVNWVLDIVNESDRLANEGVITFIDMLRQPIKLGLQLPPLYQNLGFLFIDEVQDYNNLQRELAYMFSEQCPNIRIIAAGDPEQTIFDFIGAETNSVDLTIERFNMKVMPLTKTFRCPTEHTQMLRRWVQDIESYTENAGTIQSMNLSDMVKNIQKGSLVYSHYNKDLIDTAIYFFEKGITINFTYTEFYRTLEQKMFWACKPFGGVKKVSMNQFKTVMEMYIKSSVKDLTHRNFPQSLIDEHVDYCNMLISTSEKYKDVETVIHFQDKLQRALSANENAFCTIGTIHGVKGLESENCYWINGDKQITKYTEAEDPDITDRRLLYVAGSRSKNNLFFVS